jgi:hypothetical protein
MHCAAAERLRARDGPAIPPEFPAPEYHAHNQNWAAVQDAQGVMYFGNKAVVLEYDGVSWRKIRVGETTYVRGLALDPASGTIYVGAVDELGYLEPGPDGEKVFVSLAAQLPPMRSAFAISAAFTLRPKASSSSPTSRSCAGATALFRFGNCRTHRGCKAS